MPPLRLFIQVEVGLPTSKLVDRCREVCGISTNEAIGLFIRLWIVVMAEERGGDLTGRSNAWIEEASGWRGEPGVFGAFVRETHLENGVIRDWQDKYGRLDAIRAEAARIKRNQRHRMSGGHPVDRPVDSPPDVPVDVPVDSYSSAVAVAFSSNSQDQLQKPVGRERAGESSPAPDEIQAFVAEFDFGPFAPVVEGYLRSTKRLAAVMATVRMHAQGELGHELATHRQLGLAIQQYAANEGARGFNAKYFAGHVRDSKKAVEVVSNRQANASEQRFIDREARDREIAKEEELDANRVLRQFELTRPDRYRELHGIAEDRIPKKLTMGRDFMVRAQLLTLIRAEVVHASE